MYVAAALFQWLLEETDDGEVTSSNPNTGNQKDHYAHLFVVKLYLDLKNDKGTQSLPDDQSMYDGDLHTIGWEKLYERMFHTTATGCKWGNKTLPKVDVMTSYDGTRAKVSRSHYGMLRDVKCNKGTNIIQDLTARWGYIKGNTLKRLIHIVL